IANTCLVVAEGLFEHDRQQVFSQIVSIHREVSFVIGSWSPCPRPKICSSAPKICSLEPSTGGLPNCVTAVFAFPGGLVSLVDDSRTGYPPRALFCADDPTQWWTTPNSICSHEIFTGVTPFVNLTVADIPNGAEIDVDVQ